MGLQSLQLSDFRNFTTLQLLDLDPSLTIIFAPNGVGKSNLLESIYVLATGNSPRTSHTFDLIRWGQPLARVEGSVDDGDLAVVIEPKHKHLFVNKKKVGLRSYLSRLRTVFFHPPDLHLLAGSPSGRRKFLDGLIGQLEFEYLYSLVTFHKVLRHRNILLKQGGYSTSHMEVLEEQMATAAVFLHKNRLEYLEHLEVHMVEHGLTVEYTPSPRSLRELFGESAEIMREFLREKYGSVREKEARLGFSLMGPQRDDFAVFLEDERHPAGKKQLGVYGSRGQQRVGVIALKIGECAVIEENAGNRPMLLLDDVYSELDAGNREFLTNLALSQQTIITTAEDSIFTAQLPHYSRINLGELVR